MVSDIYAVFDDLKNEFYGNALPDFRAGRISKREFLSAMESFELYNASICNFQTPELERLQEEMRRITDNTLNPNAMGILERLTGLTVSNGLGITYGLMVRPNGAEEGVPDIGEDGLKIIQARPYSVSAITFDDLYEKGMDWEKNRILEFLDGLESVISSEYQQI